MKKLTFLSGLLVAVTMSVQAQLGQVNFNNRVSSEGVDYPVVYPDGTRVTSPPWRAALGLVSTSGALTMIPGSVTTFRSGVAAGYVNGVVVDVPGTSPGQTVNLVMVAFEGESFETSSMKFQSEVVSVALGGGTIPTPNMTGFGRGSVLLVPEPTTQSIGIMAVVWILGRRALRSGTTA
jgi:hypothetical protein